ncbi:MAG TPA: aminotransferase class III-fold pyridoxal phosphate-dependent enzyme, partial [Candidatus Egerieenecus merdigallinarum]|nr:aminotransferase class III-fold pyridoxal phosphate-dependent enzyme [Candidatus Egerieenecus merdigallinarum]
MMTQQLDQQFIAPTYGRFPIALVKGQGALLTDENGKSYIDMGSGIAVNTFGACDPIWM